MWRRSEPNPRRTPQEGEKVGPGRNDSMVCAGVSEYHIRVSYTTESIGPPGENKGQGEINFMKPGGDRLAMNSGVERNAKA